VRAWWLLETEYSSGRFDVVKNPQSEIQNGKDAGGSRTHF
jgi:hypothetical protein